MTRIIAGSAKGRRLTVPTKGTRPTSDRVREAIFSALHARTDLDDARVLDLYAGSGALGLEALSRGAREVLLVESDARAAAVARNNVSTVALPGATVRCCSVAAALGTPPEQPYDLVLADPPYAVTDQAVARVLQTLVTDGFVADGSLVVLERSARGAVTEWPEGLQPEVVKTYGETRVEIAACYGPVP
ncbi:16S rRNA (guanine(966)-N(2))-methyltransferase RsmD [Rhodococcus sp. X156]|uniref:16S rRNA (guanine(966)-N(2))-methyltransferase RsmD n=1 Tax=Rhodococcus sp. X156 TaxID=2499145 RepID=UPI000FDC7009|nr:16S rRNA (guanine(966)-N(2))-methyltransferase RsmD [Rhodococcus sp. X156]